MTTTWAAKVLADVPRYDPFWKRLVMIAAKDGDYVEYDDALAAIARMGAGDGLVERATAALEGVTEGPWTADTTDPSDAVVWGQEAQTGDDYLIGNVGSSRVQNVAVVFDVDAANARFIAFTRQWVPEAAARIAALTAQVAWKNIAIEAERVAAYEKTRAEAAEARISELVEGCNQLEVMARDYAEEAAELRAKVARLEGALTAIDALDPEGRIGDCSVNAISGLVLRMGGIARAALSDGEGK